ncbi:type VII secretion protein EccB [Mycolicibacterium hassiacum DSM 44199]|uniref:Type VII secretion protein EccB n=1 Tax=Mycolicibacterium hassiacum (strain DSM 44199 / CIP 105218 / JCM 12690 / 3849) TaxID=1122247 RepID=K5BKV4_MYCHD|nr:type VII secretion protein EccB [Mycolicibacterium hassiacum]EKF25519.1 type VII secretion protein EccB [Mycolicibacterium hassiacum DSM 44199]MDA4086627.1 secretion protein EccB [Mycolicibacterium hassiacum DSM 44199]VCT92890.1 ESX-3 secretion system ATPase EccB3 [Mycolicibacterium hassiacum DSM 44199]
MTGPGEPDRRSFTSRTPVNENPDRVVYRRGFVTRHQVSGWRFMMRRIAAGVALHDARMLVDPLRTQTRSVLVGVLVLLTGLAGCFVFSLIRPAGVAGNDAILADRTTSALYVRLGDQLHPVLNLTSARLIAGRPDNPTLVKTSELDRFPRGNLIGIPGAPERLVQHITRDADWTVCDGVSGPAAGTTLIAGPLTDGGERAGALAADEAVLVRNPSGPNAGTWLLWDGRRSRIDLGDRAVTRALGWDADIPEPRPVAQGLFNALPEAPPLTAPEIPGAGEPAPYPMSVAVPVGAVVVSFDADDNLRHYAVLRDGLAPISPVVAELLRNTDSFGLNQPPRLAADEIARLPVAQGIDNDAYPRRPVTVKAADAAPLTCVRWTRPADAVAPRIELRSGVTLPVAENLRALPLVGAGSGTTADRVVLTPGRGYLVQTVGASGGGSVTPPDGAKFWVSDTGVRYGLDTDGDDKTIAALGLTPPPLPIPWSLLSQFAQGPTLSRADALLAHDTLPADPRPNVVRENP